MLSKQSKKIWKSETVKRWKLVKIRDYFFPFRNVHAWRDPEGKYGDLILRGSVGPGAIRLEANRFLNIQTGEEYEI